MCLMNLIVLSFPQIEDPYKVHAKSWRFCKFARNNPNLFSSDAAVNSSSKNKNHHPEIMIYLQSYLSILHIRQVTQPLHFTNNRNFWWPKAKKGDEENLSPTGLSFQIRVETTEDPDTAIKVIFVASQAHT